MGDGLIDAAMGAIQARRRRRRPTRELPRVERDRRAPTRFGDVVVQIDVDGRRVTGRGVATDVVEASARAYLAAVNRALQVTKAQRAVERGDAVSASYRIGVIRGDGTGPEVVGEGLKVLDAVRGDASYDLVEFDLGADRYLRTGDALPDDELERLRGARRDLPRRGRRPAREAGGPRARPAAEGPVRARPVREPAAGRALPGRADARAEPRRGRREHGRRARELRGALHRAPAASTARAPRTRSRCRSRSTPATASSASCATRSSSRCSRTGAGKLTLVHKTNVLTFAGDLYQRVVDEVAAEFPDVETDYVHVDAACIYFLDSPSRFDVIVTDNMFGDIITDLGAMIQGGMGIAAGGNINPEGVSMFEPIGGTAPSETGKGTINPLAAIGALEMLLRQLGEDDGRRPGRPRASARATQQMKSMRAGEMGYTTTEVGDLVVEGRRVSDGPGSSSTTRRCATARSRPTCRTRSRTACASCTSSTRSGSPTWRAGGPARTRATPSSSSSPRRRRCDQHAHRVRHDPPGGGARRGLAGAARPARRRHRGRLPGREGVGPARHRGAAHRPGRGRRDGARLGRVPARPGPAGVLRRRALLRRLPVRRRRSRWRCSPRPRRPAPSASCCATRTAACCRSTSRASWPR